MAAEKWKRDVRSGSRIRGKSSRVLSFCLLVSLLVGLPRLSLAEASYTISESELQALIDHSRSIELHSRQLEERLQKSSKSVSELSVLLAMLRAENERLLNERQQQIERLHLLTTELSESDARLKEVERLLETSLTALDDWQTRWKEYELEVERRIKALENERNWWRLGAVGGLIVAVGVGIITVLK